MATKVTTEAKPKVHHKYWEAVGRRKTAIARTRLMKGSGEVIVNEKSAKLYFSTERMRQNALAPMQDLNLADKFDASIKVSGGGMTAQAGAVRLGIARALCLAEPDFKKRLRQGGFLTRDSRMVERKKYGLKKARRAPQWAKR